MKRLLLAKKIAEATFGIGQMKDFENAIYEVLTKHFQRGIPTKRPNSLNGCLESEYRKLGTCKAVAEKHGVHMNSVRNWLIEDGIERFRPGIRSGQNHAPVKLLRSEYPQILQRRRNRETLQAIGDSYGVTRERIRQICGANGLVIERTTKTRDANAAKAKRKLQKIERINILSDAWRAGCSCLEMAEIAERLPATQAKGAALVSYLRKRHPKLFPNRR